MPWFRVDDKLHDHRKTRRADKGAMGVWVLAGSWSADNLTDGFVPESVLSRWGTRKDAARLVDALLWKAAEHDGECGWQFLNWDQYQPTRLEVEAEREAARQRMRNARRAKKVGANQDRSSEDVQPNVRLNVQENIERSSDNPVPTPPDPELPIGSSVARKRARQLPDDWTPNDTHRRLCGEFGIDVERERQHFVDHHTSKGSTFRDWDAAFRTWIRNSRKFGGHQGRPNEGVDWDAALARAQAREGGV